MEGMYSVMKRINDIRTRFGLRPRRNANRNDPKQPGNKYDDYHVKALEDRQGGRGLSGPTDTGSGNKIRTVEDLKKIADHHAAVNKIPPSLVKAVIEAESGFNPFAVSPKGAKGLMQLMPSTIRNFGVKNPFDPEENISAGTGLLKTLLQNYNWDYKKALAAYNAGEKAVDKKGDIPDYAETREYIKKVIKAYARNND
jgi:hypothetical protein